MKKFIVLCLGFVASLAPLSAQNNTQSDAGAPGAGGSHWKKHGNKDGPPGADLTADERKRLGDAREKAMDDPTVRSLREAKDKLEDQLDAAMRAAMLAADPSLSTTLDKVQQARGRAKEMRGKFDSLTSEQKQKLKAARTAAKDDPAVQAAREKMRAAQDPAAKREAGKAMHDAMKAAMIKADPGLASLLEQLGPGAMGPGSRHGGGPDGDRPDGPPDMDGPPDGP